MRWSIKSKSKWFKCVGDSWICDEIVPHKSKETIKKKNLAIYKKGKVFSFFLMSEYIKAKCPRKQQNTLCKPIFNGSETFSQSGWPWPSFGGDYGPYLPFAVYAHVF